jgi:hypothetical protein
MKAIKTAVGMSLLMALAAGNPLALQAAETAEATGKAKPETPAKQAKSDKSEKVQKKKPVRQELTGKVLAVDRFASTVTLQVDSLTYVLQIADATLISRADSVTSLADVVVGQEVTVNVMLRERSNGTVEVAVLSVALPDTVDAQGPGNGKAKGKGKDRKGPPFGAPPPFVNGPNPGNVDGPIISPNN